MNVRGLTVVINSDDSDDGKVVDQVPGAISFPFADVGQLAPAPPAITPLVALPSREAIDPRFNWLAATHFVQNPSGGETIGDTNAITVLALSARANADGKFERGSEMYVADRGHLLAVGELGHLVRSENMLKGMWQTIRLLDQESSRNVAQRDPVYKYFTVSSNIVERGLVNLNTPDRDILETAFLRMPERYVGSGDPIDASEVTVILDEIDQYAQNRVFTNVDDLAEIDWRTSEPDGNPFRSRSDLEIEAMLAYSAGLFGTRQNLFTIILAEGIDSGGVGVSSGEEMLIGRRAVAQVWRDPFPDDEGAHPCFVRYFKWLDD